MHIRPKSIIMQEWNAYGMKFFIDTFDLNIKFGLPTRGGKMQGRRPIFSHRRRDCENVFSPAEHFSHPLLGLQKR